MTPRPGSLQSAEPPRTIGHARPPVHAAASRVGRRNDTGPQANDHGHNSYFSLFILIVHFHISA